MGVLILKQGVGVFGKILVVWEKLEDLHGSYPPSPRQNRPPHFGFGFYFRRVRFAHQPHKSPTAHPSQPFLEGRANPTPQPDLVNDKAVY